MRYIIAVVMVLGLCIPLVFAGKSKNSYSGAVTLYIYLASAENDRSSDSGEDPGFETHAPVNLIGYDKHNEDIIVPENEEEYGIHVFVNSMRNSEGKKVSQNFQDEDGKKLQFPSEARRIELEVEAPDDDADGNATYTIKLKLESDDKSAAQKVAIWQVPEGTKIDKQEAWVIKVGGAGPGEPGMTPREPILTIKGGDDRKTLTFWLEGRKPVTNINTPVALVAEMYIGSQKEPIARDVLRLNPIEFSYIRPAIHKRNSDNFWRLNCGERIATDEIAYDVPVCGYESKTDCWCEHLPFIVGDGNMYGRWANGYNSLCMSCRWDRIFPDDLIPDEVACGRGKDTRVLCRDTLTLRRLISVSPKAVFLYRVAGVPRDKLNGLALAGNMGKGHFDTMKILLDTMETTNNPKEMTMKGDIVLTSNEFVVVHDADDWNYAERMNFIRAYTGPKAVRPVSSGWHRSEKKAASTVEKERRAEIDKDLESYMRIWQCPFDAHICSSYEECYNIINAFKGRYVMACSKEALAIRSIGKYMKHFQEVALLLMDRIDLYEGGREFGTIIDPSEVADRNDKDRWPVRYVFNRYLKDHWNSYGKLLPQKEWIDMMTPVMARYLEYQKQGDELKYGILSRIFGGYHTSRRHNRVIRMVLAGKEPPHFSDFMLGKEGTADNIPNTARKKCYNYPDGLIYLWGEECLMDMARKNTIILHVHAYSQSHLKPTRYRLSLDKDGKIVREKLDAEKPAKYEPEKQ